MKEPVWMELEVRVYHFGNLNTRYRTYSHDSDLYCTYKQISASMAVPSRHDPSSPFSQVNSPFNSIIFNAKCSV